MTRRTEIPELDDWLEAYRQLSQKPVYRPPRWLVIARLCYLPWAVLVMWAVGVSGCGQQPSARAASFVAGGAVPTTPEGSGYFDDDYGVWYGSAAWCEVTTHCVPEAVAIAEGMPTPKVPWVDPRSVTPNATPCG